MRNARNWKEMCKTKEERIAGMLQMINDLFDETALKQMELYCYIGADKYKCGAGTVTNINGYNLHFCYNNHDSYFEAEMTTRRGQRFYLTGTSLRDLGKLFGLIKKGKELANEDDYSKIIKNRVDCLTLAYNNLY